MLLEQFLWGTYLASLVISGSVEPTEPPLHTLARRQPKPPAPAAPPKNGDAVNGTIQCGDSFGSNNPEGQPGWLSCRSFAGLSFYCPTDKCHIGSPKDTPLTAPLSRYAFQNCELYSSKDHLIVNTAEVDSFMAHNLHGVSVVKGPSKNVYVCRWLDKNNVNSVRPCEFNVLT
ncbi:hypothetical protein PGT21_035561 [Puccinia graminis f. sp. tritici]|uniref:Uncharacterized protein n=1 Tax=Puccinia graminis f. sp. tritici TaxID=56615 RepID=A0A5B0MJE9_PUCGR|nr:hypothetical protein PGTUg99_036892 [Puccinia graminis f. sp. tritici]KAA1091553.1 hypothetical protein PGT21_035561 [Puccinia graminis f. sp. tritici]